jgi:hypothetical protein
MREFTESTLDIFACWLAVSPMPSITGLQVTRFRCGGFWIADAIRSGFPGNSGRLCGVIAGIEFLVLDDQTRLRQFKQELRSNEVYYALRSGFVS